MQPGEKRDLYNGFGDTLARAFEFAVTPLLFGLLGHWLDGRFGITPTLTISFVVVVVAYMSWRLCAAYSAQMKAHESQARWSRTRARS